MYKNYLIYEISIILLLILFIGCVEQQNQQDSPDAWKPEFGINYSINVTTIIDGDTFNAIFPTGEEERIRLLGIDTPELFPNNDTMQKFNNVSDLNCLNSYAFTIRSFTESWLKSKSIYIQFDEYTGFYDFHGRWLGYITLQNGTDFNKVLLEKGFARVYEDETFEKKGSYLMIQDEAIKYKIGLWSCIK